MSTPIPSRRTILKGAAALSFAGTAGTLLPDWAFAQVQSAGPVPLTAAEGIRAAIAGQGNLALFNDSLPGPVLRVKKGSPLSVQFTNSLKEGVALTWQGVRLPGDAAAMASASVPAGQNKLIQLTPKDAGTFWYHAASPTLARRALSGAVIVDEPGTPAYASDNLLFIQSFPPESGVPIFPVNGEFSPTFQGPASGRSRLRLVNATPLFLRLRLKGPAAYVIAIDGQPVAQPFELKDGRLQMPPGGRVDVAATIDDADATIIEIETTQEPIRLAVVTPVGPAGPMPSGPPTPLPPNDLPADIPLKDAVRVDMPIGEKTGAPNSLGTVKSGKAMVLTLANSLDAPVSVHVAGHAVRLLDGLDDGWKPWWHDTVPVPAKATVRVALLAQAPGTWSVTAQRGGDGEVVASATYLVSA